VQAGYLGILGPLFARSGGLQVPFDLVIALVLVMIWMVAAIPGPGCWSRG